MAKQLITLRLNAFDAQNHRCYYCERAMWIKVMPQDFATRNNITQKQAEHRQATAEHLKARCEGGQDTPDNIVAACRRCNSSRHRCKRPLSPPEYKNYVLDKIKHAKWGA